MFTNERLYYPRNCSYLKFILIPGLIGFILLCILMNVKFNMDPKVKSTSNEEKNETQRENRMAGTLEQSTDTIRHLVPAAACVEDVPNCALTCANGSVGFVDQDLEYLQSTASCSTRELTLTFKDCEFSDGVMKLSFFIGDYRLTALKILNCNLETIQAGAFQKNTVKKLKSLELINNTITSLQSETFEGLNVLANFKFLQQPLMDDKFQGCQFLKPMATSLQNANILQRTEWNNPVNLQQWLQGPDLTALLTLDLSNNNLRGILNGETFRTLVAVRTLLLQNCYLDSIDMAPFDPIQHLDVLYLNNNHLMTLGTIFMDQIQAKGIIISTSGNEWICDCENIEMIDYLQGMESSLSLNVKDYICFVPSEWSDVNMLDVRLDCKTTTAEGEDEKTSPVTTFQTDLPTDVTTDLSTDLPTDVTTDLSTYLPTHVTTDLPTDATTDLTTDLTTDFTTDFPNDLLYIQCFKENSSELSFIVVKSKLVHFTVQTTSTTSVAITSTHFNGNLFVIYFNDYSQYRNASQTVPFKWEINHLKAEENYIFCVVLDTGGTTAVSPFDCQGHSMESAVKSWLSTEDKSWSIIVITVFALHCGLLGMVLIYFILRKRPTWLYTRSHRVLRKPNYSHKIVLLPKKSSRMTRVSRPRPVSQSQENRVTYLVPESQQTDVNSNVPHPLYASLHIPPSEMAPTVPNIYLQLPLTPTIPRVNNNHISWSGSLENSASLPEGYYIDAIDNISNIYNDIASDYSVLGIQEDPPLNGLSEKFVKAIGAVEGDYDDIDFYEEVTF